MTFPNDQERREHFLGILREKLKVPEFRKTPGFPKGSDVPDPKKAEDLEKLRERALLREFEDYRETKQRRLKVFRLEAVRAGFKKAWQDRDYPTIIAVAEKIPDKVLQEDPKLLMWYEQAVTRAGGDL
jgi:hypothetical protein